MCAAIRKRKGSLGGSVCRNTQSDAAAITLRAENQSEFRRRMRRNIVRIARSSPQSSSASRTVSVPREAGERRPGMTADKRRRTVPIRVIYHRRSLNSCIRYARCQTIQPISAKKSPAYHQPGFGSRDTAAKRIVRKRSMTGRYAYLLIVTWIPWMLPTRRLRASSRPGRMGMRPKEAVAS